MKPNALILPAAIRSHVLPSLYVADLLAVDYEVHYAVQNDTLADIATTNGYRTVRQSSNLVGYGMEPNYIVSLKQKPTYWRVLKAYYTHELYYARQRELYAIIDDLRPQVIIIDLFACTDYWVLHPRRAEFKMLFFNSMPSVYKPHPNPLLSKERELLSPLSKKLPLSSARRGGWGVRSRHRRFLERIAPLASDATMTQVIANVPELILAPLAFELTPELRKPHQHYLGLCMRPHRQDTELDPTFETAWESITISKKVPLLFLVGPSHGGGFRGRLIYCSFGTFHEGADATLLRFVTNLLEVVAQLPHVQLVCSVNKYVIETLRHRRLLTANTHFFSRVPQMRVLAEADVFITHAGFGSIKESIYYGVPMLAYPLDPKYDQNANALKLEHHGLGLRGNFTYERPNDLKNKLLRLLEEDTFRERVRQFREAANEQHSPETMENQLSTLLGRKPKNTLTLDLRESQ